MRAYLWAFVAALMRRVPGGMKVKVEHLASGQPFVIPKDGYYYDECCDCNLVHLINITKHKGKYIWVSWRDDYMTRLARRARRKR